MRATRSRLSTEAGKSGSVTWKTLRAASSESILRQRSIGRGGSTERTMVVGLRRRRSAPTGWGSCGPMRPPVVPGFRVTTCVPPRPAAVVTSERPVGCHAGRAKVQTLQPAVVVIDAVVCEAIRVGHAASPAPAAGGAGGEGEDGGEGQQKTLHVSTTFRAPRERKGPFLAARQRTSGPLS